MHVPYPEASGKSRRATGGQTGGSEIQKGWQLGDDHLSSWANHGIMMVFYGFLWVLLWFDNVIMMVYHGLIWFDKVYNGILLGRLMDLPSGNSCYRAIFHMAQSK